MLSRRLAVCLKVLVIGKLLISGPLVGADDRLRHLEEVDILRHLSVRPNPHVIKFEDAWEQNRQLFIQTELCLGSLAFFLLEYGSVVERLDEARVWKIVRELSDVSDSEILLAVADRTGYPPYPLEWRGSFRHQACKHPHLVCWFTQDW